MLGTKFRSCAHAPMSCARRRTRPARTGHSGTCSGGCLKRVHPPCGSTFENRERANVYTTRHYRLVGLQVRRDPSHVKQSKAHRAVDARVTGGLSCAHGHGARPRIQRSACRQRMCSRAGSWRRVGAVKPCAPSSLHCSPLARAVSTVPLRRCMSTAMRSASAAQSPAPWWTSRRRGRHPPRHALTSPL